MNSAPTGHKLDVMSFIYQWKQKWDTLLFDENKRLLKLQIRQKYRAYCASCVNVAWDKNNKHSVIQSDFEDQEIAFFKNLSECNLEIAGSMSDWHWECTSSNCCVDFNSLSCFENWFCCSHNWKWKYSVEFLLTVCNCILQPNGRFETHKKICLSISGYHPETWQPSWSCKLFFLLQKSFYCIYYNLIKWPICFSSIFIYTISVKFSCTF